MTQDKHLYIFKKYLPENSVNYCYDLWALHKFSFKVTAPRQSKFGDYCYRKDKGHQITVNSNLNPYSFLITYIHEVAHLVTYKQYGNKKDPHGKEWKQNFLKTFLPVLSNEVLPPDLLEVLTAYLQNPSASTQGYTPLVRILQTYDLQTDEVPLTSLKEGDQFIIRGQTFVKGLLRRTRYLCTDAKTSKRYVISATALVKKL